MVIERGSKFKNLYTDIRCSNMIIVVDGIINLSLWNNIFGYMSEKGVKMLEFW